MAVTRHESSVTAISWIPAEAIEGLSKVPFELGVTHYDVPPPDRINDGDLEELRKSDRFREANELRAYVDVEDGRIVGYGYLGGGKIGATTVRVGPAAIRFAAVHLPDIQKEPEVSETSVRFVQTVGGRMGIPTPRPVKRRPFVQFWPSIAWSTLELTINADGSTSRGLAGASPFPRHYLYDERGELVEKSAVIDFRAWADHCFGDGTPWGSYDSERLTTTAESALERELSETVLRGGSKPRIRVVDAGGVLTTQGEAATDVYVVIDGLFTVEIDGENVAEIGPGAVVGERAALEHGIRTATLRASTRARVAEIAPGELNASILDELQATRKTAAASS